MLRSASFEPEQLIVREGAAGFMNCARKSLIFVSTEHSTTALKERHGRRVARLAGMTTASCGLWCWRMRAARQRGWTRFGSRAAATSAEHPWACSRRTMIKD